MQDSILFWNAVALEANRVSFSDPAKAEQQGPTLSSRALAIVHLAMYDAYARIENDAAQFPLYLPSTFAPTVPSFPPAEKEKAKKEAVAGAAYTTLAALYSTQKEFFNTQVLFFETDFSAPVTNPNAPATPFQLGVVVANELLGIRSADPGVGDAGHILSSNHGRHRPDPDNPRQGIHAPFYGALSKVFAVSQRYALDAPPYNNGNDPKYKKALKQVRAKGIKQELMAELPSALFNARRTADESVIGIFWGYDGANQLGTPPRLYNQVVRQVALNVKTLRPGETQPRVNNEGDNARLFAFVNAAMGDAGILAWEQKYRYDLWRPVLGIREHDASLGPGASVGKNNLDDDADPFWLPLGAPNTNNPTKKNFTPNFPAYPSGHATFGAAAFHITRLFYGKGFGASGTAVIPGGKKIIKNGNLVEDDLFDGLNFISDEFNGVNQDNRETVRPRHARSFDLDNGDKPSSGGLGKMIIENARSRVYLGVHWIFDAFSAKSNSNPSKEIEPDFSANGLNIGGVPLGLKIAEDIFMNGNEKAPKITSDDPNTQPLAAAAAEKSAKAKKKAKGEIPTQAELTRQTEDQKIETPFLSGISDR